MSSPDRTIFLIGFMATGKTAVGRQLSERRGQRFVDLDEMITRDAHMSVAEIFDREGEAGFRSREADALASVIAGEPAVVATGGGAPCFGDSLAAMKAGGLVVALTAELDASVQRAAASDVERPLLAQSPAQIEALHRSRQPIYRQAHVGVGTDDRTAAQVAADVDRLVDAVSWIPEGCLGGASIVAPASGDPYPVLVSSGSLDRLGEMVRASLGDKITKVGVVSDSNVAPLYGVRARGSLEAAGFTVVEAEIPAGEGSKSFAQLETLCAELVDAGLDRGSAIIALGGGVVGDLAGFVAASLFRGIPCVQVPTTMLAMVDSAIGGKTGINIPAGKNLVGAFWQPRLVLADPEVLTTLPGRERRAAFGEMLKYALLDGEDLYALFEALAPHMKGDDPAPVPDGLEEAIQRCAAIKAWIVTRDARESGERALLNLGHTVGHAIEAATAYTRYLHGEAVGLGLLAACRVSARLGLCDPSIEGRVATTLSKAGLDTDIDAWLTPPVIDRIRVDKKRTGSRINFITIAKVGSPALTELELDELRRILPARSAV